MQPEQARQSAIVMEAFLGGSSSSREIGMGAEDKGVIEIDSFAIGGGDGMKVAGFMQD